MDQHNAFIPNEEKTATIIATIQVSDQLGKSTGSLKTIGELTPARAMGQGGVGIFPNAGNGNLYVEDHKVTVVDGSFKHDLGLCYNSQGTPPWKVSIGQKIQFNTNHAILTLDDGAQVTFTSSNGTLFTAQTALGNFELTRNPDGSCTVISPDASTSSQFNPAGFETDRVDSAGVGIQFVYHPNNSLSKIILPSKRSIQWCSKPNSDGGLTIDVSLYDTHNTLQSNLMQHEVDANFYLTKTRIALDDRTYYEIDYHYRNGHTLDYISQTDTTTATFSYETFAGKTVVSEVTDGEGRMTHFDYDEGQRTWQQANDPDSLTSAHVDTRSHVLRLSKPRLHTNDDGTVAMWQEKTNYNYANDRLSGITYNAGSSKDFQYDPKTGLLCDETNNLGLHEQTFFDQTTRLKVAFKTSANVAGKVQNTYEFFVYDPKGRLRYHISAAGKVTQLQWDDRLSVITTKRIQLASRFDNTNYSENVLPTQQELDTWWSQQDITKSTLQSIEHNQYGHETKNTEFAHVNQDGSGHVTDAMLQKEYDDLLPTGEWQTCHTRQSSAKTGTQTRILDGLRREIAYIDSLSRETTICYNDAEQTVTIKRPSGLIETQIQDHSGLSTAKTQSDGNITRTSLLIRDDKRGAIKNLVTPTMTYQVTYDASGRLYFTVDSNDALANKINLFTFDDRENLTTLSEFVPQSGKPARHHTILKDVADNNRYIIDGDGYVEERLYDLAHHHLVSIHYKIPLDPATPRVLTADGHLKGITASALDSVDLREFYFVDADGHILGTQDKGGFISAFHRNTAGQLQATVHYKDAQARPATWAAALASVTQSDSELTQRVTDLLDNIESQLNQEGLQTLYEWLGNGQWSTCTHKNADTTQPDAIQTQNFDTENRLRDHEIVSQNILHHNEFDNHDEVCDQRTIDLNTNQIVRHTTTQRNAFSTIDKTTGPREDEQVHYIYDTQTGLLRFMIDSEGNRTIIYKDSQDRTVAKINSENYLILTIYNGFGKEWLTKRYVMKQLSDEDCAQLAGGLMTDVVTNVLAPYLDPNADRVMTQDYDNRGNITDTSKGGKYKVSRHTNAFGNLAQISKDNGDGTAQVETFEEHCFPGSKPGINRVHTVDPKGLNYTSTEQLNYQHLVATRTEASGAVHNYNYDSLKNQTSHEDVSRGATETHMYDHLKRATSHVDFLKNETKVIFNDAERSRTIHSPEGDTQKITQDALGRDQNFTDAAGNTYSLLHNPAGDIKAEVDAEGKQTDHEITPMGFHTGTYFPNGLEHRQMLNKVGHVLAQFQLADNEVVVDQFTPNAMGESSLHIDANQNQHHTQRNLAGDVTLEHTDLADGVSFNHQTPRNGQGIATADTYQDEEQTFATTLKHDVLGRNIGHIQDPKTTANPNGLNLETTRILDANGCTRELTNARNKKFWEVRDAIGRLRYRISALGFVTAYQHNPMQRIYTCRYINPIATGSLSDKTTPDMITKLIGSNVAQQEIYYFYNKNGQLIYEVTGLGFVTEHLYDKAKRPQGIRQYATSVDVNHAVIKGDSTSVKPIQNPTQDRINIEVYNQAGKLRYKINGRGQITEYKLDDAYNPVEVIQYATLLDLTQPIAWEENVIASKIKSSSNDRVKYQIFDQRSRLRYVIDEEQYITSYEYDSCGNEIDAYSYPDQLPTIPTTRDLTTLAALTETNKNNPKTRHINTTWDALSRKVGKADLNSDVTVTREEKWRFTALHHVKEYTDQEEFVWKTECDNAGRKVKTITPVTDIYDVIEDPDNPGKIKLASLTPTRDTRVDTHELDGSGNLIAFKKSTGSDVQNANARVSNQTFDDDGRLISASVAQVPVDNPKLQPAKPGDSATTPQTVQKTYVHNAFNKKLVEIDESQHAHFYVYDVDQRLIYEVSATGAVRLYERNSFGEVIKLTQYATKITLDLTRSIYRENGLTQAQIEAAGVIITNSDDRSISFDYNQSAVRTNTTLPPQLLAWIEEDQLKWSVDIGPITNCIVNSFDEKTAEHKLVHGGTAPEWTHEHTWRNRCGTPIITATSVGDGTYNVEVRTVDYQKNDTELRKIAVTIDGVLLFDDHNQPFDNATTLLHLAHFYNDTEDHLTAYERNALGVAIKTILKQELVHQASIQENGKPGKPTSTRKDLTTEVLKFDRRNLKPTQTKSPKGIVSEQQFDELGRDAGAGGPMSAQSTDPNPVRSASRSMKGYNAFDDAPVVEAKTFERPPIPMPGAEYDPSPSEVHTTLRLMDDRGLMAIEQNANSVPKYTSYQANRLPARRYHFQSVQVPSKAEQTYQSIPADSSLSSLEFNPITQSGVCLFQAIAHSLGKDVEHVRQEVADYLEHHCDELAHYRPHSKKPSATSQHKPKKVLTGTIADSTYTFSEEFVSPNGDCAFTAIGTDRQRVTAFLRQHISNPAVRAQLKEEIQEAFESKQLNTREAFELYQQRDYQQKAFDGRYRILGEIHTAWQPIPGQEQEDQISGFIAWLEAEGFPADADKLLQQRLSLFYAEDRLGLYYTSVQAAEHYINGLESGLWLGYQSALLYAEANHFNLFIWRKDEAGDQSQLALTHSHQTAHPTQVFHILHTDQFTHFNLLVESEPTPRPAQADADPQVAFKQYIDAIRKGDEWDDDIELQLIQQALKKPIVVVSAKANPLILNSEDSREDETIFLYRNNKKQHYDALLPKEDTQVSAVLACIQSETDQGNMVTYNPFSQPGDYSSQVGTITFTEALQLAQTLYAYDGDHNMTFTCLVETDGTRKPLYIKFNTFNEAIAHGTDPDGKIWPQMTILLPNGKPLFEIGSDGVPRIKLHNGLGAQVAEIKKPSNPSLTDQVVLTDKGEVQTATALQDNIVNLLEHLKERDDFANYQTMLWATDHLKRVLKRYQTKRTIQDPRTPEPFYTAFEVGSAYPEFGQTSISWPAPQDEFLTDAPGSTEHKSLSYMRLSIHGLLAGGIKLPIQVSKDGTRHFVNVTGLATDLYDYDLKYFYNSVLGGGEDLGTNTPRTYEAKGQALPVITSDTENSVNTVVQIFNYNQLRLAGHFDTTPTTVDIVRGTEVHTFALTRVTGVDSSFTADLSSLTTGDYQVSIHGKVLPEVYTIVTATLPDELCAVEIAIPDMKLVASDCHLTEDFKMKHNELHWLYQITGNIETTNTHPLLQAATKPTVHVNWAVAHNQLKGSSTLPFHSTGTFQFAGPNGQSAASDMDYSKMIDSGFLINEATLSITLGEEQLALFSNAPFNQVMGPATPPKQGSSDHQEFNWSQLAEYRGNCLLFSGLPDTIDSFSIEYFDYSIYKHGVWWDLFDQAKLSDSKKHLMVDVSALPPGQLDFHVVFYDVNKQKIQTCDKKVNITHGKDAIPVGPQTQHYHVVQPVESQTHSPLNTTSHTDAHGNTWYYKKNKRGYLVETQTPPYATLGPDHKQIAAQSFKKQKGFDEDGHPTVDSDENEHVTNYTVNESGDRLETLYPDGVLERFVIDGFHNTVTVRSIDGVLETRGFDNLGDLTRVTKVEGEDHLFFRDEQRQIKREKTAAGRMRHANHNLQNCETESYNANGQRRKMTYDRNKKPLTIDDGVALPMQYFRDFFGNLDINHTGGYQIIDKSGAQISVTMDNNKCILTRQSSGGKRGHYLNPISGGYEPTPDQNLKFIYDEAGKVIYILDEAMDTRTLKHYDIGGDCVAERFMNSDGRVVQDTQIVLNAVGWLTQVFDDVMQAEYEYDAKGNRRHTIVRIKPDNTFVLLNVDDWFTYNEADRAQYDGCAMINGIVDVSFDPITNKPKGRLLIYDKDGKRTQEIYQNSGDTTDTKAKIISYNPRNQVSSIDIADYNKDTKLPKNRKPYQQFDQDADGVRSKLSEFDPNQHKRTDHAVEEMDGEGRPLRIHATQNNTSTGQAIAPIGSSKNPNISVTTFVEPLDIDGNSAGNTVSFPDDQSPKNRRDTYKNGYVDTDHRQLATVTGQETFDGKSSTPTTATTGIDSNGQTSSRDGQAAAGDGYRRFWTNADGRIVMVQNGATYKNGADFEYYFYDPRTNTPIGRFGNIPPVGSPLMAQVDLQTYRDINFNLNYHPIDKYYPPQAPGQYTAISAQTYDEISTIVYGDARFGTELATSNGGGSGTDNVCAGRTLTIPPLDTVMYNNQADQASYSSQALIGSLNPEIPQLRPEIQHHYLTQILDAIIALIAAIASTYVGGEGWILFAEVMAISIATDLATQAVNMATGAQQHFDFKSLAISAITSIAASAGSEINSAFKITEFFEKMAVNEAMEIAQQGLETALHLEHHLQWADFVAAGLNTGVAKLKDEKLSKGIFTTLKIANAGIEATLNGLDSKHHRIDPLNVATSMLGTTLAQLTADHEEAVKAAQAKAIPKAKPVAPSHTDGLTPGEHALHHSDNYKPQDTYALQQQAQARKEQQLSQMQAEQAVSAHHTQAQQNAHADNDDAYVESVRHLLFSGGAKLPGSGLMLLNGQPIITHPIPKHNSVETQFKQKVIDPLRNDYNNSTKIGALEGLGKGLVNDALVLLDSISGGSSGMEPQLHISPNQRLGADLAMGGLFAIPLLRGGIGENIESETLASGIKVPQHPLTGWGPEQVINHVNQLGLKTPRDQLILWSGLGRGDAGIRLSQEYVAANGGITLEMTAGGKWLDELDLFGMNSPFSQVEARQIWSSVSTRMIQQASGQVRSLVGAVNPSSIYRAEQTEILMNDKILGLDELNLKPRYVFGNY